MRSIAYLLDQIAQAAYYAGIEEKRRGAPPQVKVPPTQVNKLLEILETTKSIELTIAFLGRQLRRGAWKDKNSAKILFNILNQVRTQVSDPDEALRIAREVLGVFKWLYEAHPRRAHPSKTPTTFTEYIKWCFS